jgi:hypothetical protein
VLLSYVLSAALAGFGVAAALWTGARGEGLAYLGAAALFVVGGAAVSVRPRPARPGRG